MVRRSAWPLLALTTVLQAALVQAVLIQTVLIRGAQASLLRPLLDLMRPQLEGRLSQACVRQLAGSNDADLAARLQAPCQAIAAPISRCLVEETDRAGRSLSVISDLLAGRFGDDSERVVKRCLARQLGLEAGSLDPLPLRELLLRYGAARP